MSNTLMGRGSKDIGLDNNSLRPVVYDGDIKKYTIYGAVVSVMLNSDGTYNSDYIYDILITLADKNIIPHISIDDSDEDGTKYTVLYASVDDGEVLLSYIKLDQENNGNIYNVVLKADGTYTKMSIKNL